MTNPPDGAPTPDSAPEPAGGLGPGAMRIGDTERTSALDSLAEHLAAGRITLDEYGDRSARVTIARTVDELLELFDDLPAPHPVMSVPGAAVASTPTGSPPARRDTTRGDLDAADRRSRAQTIVAAAASASVFVALALFFITGTWLWFLLIPAISGIAQAVWGPDWKEPPRGRPRELGDGKGH
mgnify:CR=1 FL=1